VINQLLIFKKFTIKGKKVMVKVQYLIQRFLHKSSRPEAIHNLGSGSWLAWANNTAVHYAPIHCPCLRKIGPSAAASRHTTTPISHTRPSPCIPWATTHFPSCWRL